MEEPRESLQPRHDHTLEYLQTWILKLSHSKTVTTAFNLNNRKAKRELAVYNNLLLFCIVTTYLGVKLDGSLTFCHHIEILYKKLKPGVALLRRLVGSGWGADKKKHCRKQSSPWCVPHLSTAHQSSIAVLLLA